jgi:starvation-inducible DNA-binding protein
MEGITMAHNHNDGHNRKLLVSIQPNIGLEGNARQSVTDILNITLADEAVLKTKTRSAHWNVRGADFFKLHTLFETQYDQLNDISDEIAERARMLGGYTIGSLQEFLDHTRLEERPGNVPDILRLLADHEAVIRFLRGDATKCAEEYEDEGSFEFLVSVIRLHEKMAWMLRSSLETEQTPGEGQEEPGVLVITNLRKAALRKPSMESNDTHHQ